MSEQHLDRAQVGAGFQQMSSKTMSKQMRVNTPLIEVGAFGCALTCGPHDLGGYRTARGVPGVAGKEPLALTAPESSPIIAKRIEQLRAQHHVTVAVALTAMNVDHHPPAVDVAHLKMCGLGAACTGSIERHQHGAMKRAVGRVDESSHLFRTENLWQPNHLPRIRRL